MLFAFAALLFAAWVFLVVGGMMLNGFVHLFLLFSIIVVIVRIIQNERAR